MKHPDMAAYTKIVGAEGDWPCDCGCVSWLILGNLLKLLKTEKILTAEQIETAITETVTSKRSVPFGGGPARIEALLKATCEIAEVAYQEPADD